MSAFCYTVQKADVDRVGKLVAATNFFTPEEVAIARELVEARLEKGDASGYRFVLMEEKGALLGYACYGRIFGTDASFDLYWIAVDSNHQSRGLGRRILAATEAAILAQGGKRVYVETSGRAQYDPTRAFYEKNGYQVGARFTDFYRTGDDKVVYVKVLARKPA